MTPSERQQKIEDLKKKHAQKILALKAAVDRLLGTEDGRAVFRYLRDECGFADTTLVQELTPTGMPTGRIATESMLYNEARRSVYINFRKLVRPKLLKELEYDEEIVEKTPE